MRISVRGIVGKLFCLCRLHRFEGEPSTQDRLQVIGEWAVFDLCTQGGSRKCLRAGCKATQAVKRTGLRGVGASEPKWQKV